MDVMNNYQKELYENLITLVDENDAFFFNDHELDGKIYRIFSYRLASYGDFCLPGALEARGNTFLMNGEEPHLFVSHAMEKFFNLHENPFTMDIDFQKVGVKEIMNKEDGSLISSFNHDSNLYLKTKNSLSSEQALDAMDWLTLDENIDRYNFVEDMTMKDFTVNMEWTAPRNRIVIGYDKPSLTILNIRDNTDGTYLEKSLFEDNHVVQDFWVEEAHEHLEGEFLNLFVADIPNMENIEGFVLTLNSGQRVKIKTSWYLVRHRAKDSLNAPRRLFEAIIGEAVDDMKSLFYGDESALKLMSDMEDLVIPKFNSMVDQVETFHRENIDLERKEYAIKGTSLKDGLMPLYMFKFDSREPDYRAFAIKNFKKFIGELL